MSYRDSVGFYLGIEIFYLDPEGVYEAVIGSTVFQRASREEVEAWIHERLGGSPTGKALIEVYRGVEIYYYPAYGIYEATAVGATVQQSSLTAIRGFVDSQLDPTELPIIVPPPPVEPPDDIIEPPPGEPVPPPPVVGPPGLGWDPVWGKVTATPAALLKALGPAPALLFAYVLYSMVNRK